MNEAKVIDPEQTDRAYLMPMANIDRESIPGIELKWYAMSCSRAIGPILDDWILFEFRWYIFVVEILYWMFLDLFLFYVIFHNRTLFDPVFPKE